MAKAKFEINDWEKRFQDKEAVLDALNQFLNPHIVINDLVLNEANGNLTFEIADLEYNPIALVETLAVNFLVTVAVNFI